MQLILATTNLHKIREIKDILKSIPNLDLLTLAQFPNYTPLEETGTTFEEIVIQKATHAAKQLNGLVLADDSGISVASLKNAPGVRSKRFAGEHATDSENRRKLLADLSSFSGDERVATITCSIALASPEGLIKCVTGFCEGSIATEERGRNGFGYDPIFIKLEYEKTFAELDESTKNRISHRRKAFERMIHTLEAL
jgi:XTP/dITP diphosphohydrolase